MQVGGQHVGDGREADGVEDGGVWAVGRDLLSQRRAGLRVVEDRGWAERAHEVSVLRRRGGHDLVARGSGVADGKAASRAGPTVDEDLLAVGRSRLAAEVWTVEADVERQGRGDGREVENRRRPALQRHLLAQLRRRRLRRQRVLLVCPEPRVRCLGPIADGGDAVAHLEALDARPDLLHYPRERHA